jgi:centromere-localized protein 2
MPPPNETTILTNVLLAPAPLPTIIPPARFTALFPAPARANPQIDVLYRELQHQRALLMDRVAAHIVAESDRGAAQRRDMARTWRDVGRNWVGETEGWGMREVGMEEVVSRTAWRLITARGLTVGIRVADDCSMLVLLMVLA